jgi:chromosome segregation protein
MTRLKALELFGFKSFADRTRFDFPPGVTAVVGPNGSGKSNVVDGIKWVLGEQSVRSLRGRDMTDVIFAGSGGRKPLGAAEVSLVFDNADALLPVDAPQVQITRRVYRSGENEYLINGEVSRLRDIRELFSGTGAATEAYSVIEQGRVDALLVASGRDRRAVFEEAAGITRFRARRTEALRRLERSEQNRQRLADIVGEVASRLETVRHQAARARRWQAMTERLRLLRLTAARQDLVAIDAVVTDVEAALSTAQAQAAEADARRVAAEAAVAELGAAQAALEPDLEAARSLVATERARSAAAEATRAAVWARRRDVAAELARLDDDHQRANRDRAAAVTALAASEAEATALENEAESLTERLSGCERAAAGSHEHVARARQELAERTAHVTGLERARQRLQSEFERTAARVEEAHRVVGSWRQRIESATGQLGRLQETAATWEGALAALEEQAAAAGRAIETLEVTHGERTEAVDAAWQSLADWQAKLEACRERRTMLQEMVRRQDGLSDATRRLLAEAEPARMVPGLRGPLAECIDADVAWAPLVDLALGTLSQSLVVGPLDDLLAWHAAWSSTPEASAVQEAGGRVVFLPAAAGTAADGPDLSDQPGIVGRLDRLCGAAEPAAGEPTRPESVRQLVTRLLGRVWIVERLVDVASLLATAPAGTIFMNRAGDCLTADGGLEIGQAAAATGLVARRSELKALEHRAVELEHTVEDASALLGRLRESLDATRRDMREAQGRRQQAAERVASARADLARAAREEAQAREAISALEASLRDAERQAVELGGQRDRDQAAVEAAERELATAREQLARAASDIDTVDRSRDEVLEEMQRLRVEQAACGERLVRARDAVAARRQDLARCGEDVATTAGRRSDAERRLEALELELLAATSVQAEAAVAAERAADVLGERAAAHDRVLGDRRAAAASLEEWRAAATVLAETIHGHELSAGEARHRRARILERVRDDYDLTPEDLAREDVSAAADAADALPEMPADRTELDAEVETLRKKLASMTTVNMEALAEAEALTERLAGLETQLADVTNAKAAIEQLVARIDDESRRLLAETIETVRGHFRELFERLFGGGQADIVVEEGVDLLEAAVEIVSRPPGKEPRNISLLSGGEKTMTCVALLLAIFRSRPSPFCVLDEVDAALDEANVDRFAGVLRDFLSSTQFIVVTHSKKTMSAADTLYGVTMEESGVSKRISVRLEAAAAAPAQPARKAA